MFDIFGERHSIHREGQSSFYAMCSAHLCNVKWEHGSFPLSHLDIGIVYTLDHEVISRPCKNGDWLLNLSQDHFSLHQGKKCQSDHGVQGPHKTYSKAYIIH